MTKLEFSFLATLILVFPWTALPIERLPDSPPIPADNPMTPEKISLGRQLYFDARISKNGKVSCQSCHDVTKGGEDHSDVSTGIDGKKGNRSAPTVWNAAFMTSQFWDGRAATLEDQAKGPMVNPVEMGNPNHEVIVKRLKKIPGYLVQFEKVFGAKNPVTLNHLVMAIAAYERTLVTPNSPVDRFLKGESSALSASAQRGMKLVEKFGCTSCHSGPNFAGPKMKMGEGFFRKFPTFPGSEYESKYHLTEDPGRYVVTHKEEDKNMWRVPTWRNIALTAPYFHNGSVKTLDEAVRVMAKTQLNLTPTESEVSDIVAFLEALTGERPQEKAPKLP